MNDYLVVIESGDGAYSAYVPDLPGCVAAASSVEEVERLIGEAISLHIESLREHGEPVPAPSSSAKVVRVA